MRVLFVAIVFFCILAVIVLTCKNILFQGNFVIDIFRDGVRRVSDFITTSWKLKDALGSSSANQMVINSSFYSSDAGRAYSQNNCFVKFYECWFCYVLLGFYRFGELCTLFLSFQCLILQFGLLTFSCILLQQMQPIILTCKLFLDDKFINMIFKFLQRPPTLTGLNTSISKSWYSKNSSHFINGVCLYEEENIHYRNSFNRFLFLF